MTSQHIFLSSKTIAFLHSICYNIIHKLRFHFRSVKPGVAPQASRESHFVGFAIFLPAFCIDIYFITLTQTCGAHFAHRRFFFLLKFCARAYSGYLFRQRFPAAGCRVQVANFMLMRFAIFLARAYSLHRFCYSNLASHIVWCLFFVECTSRLQTSSYGARFLVHRKNQPARKPPGFPYPPPRAPAPTAVFYPGFSPRPGRPPQGPRWRSISASASQPPGRSPYTWQSARG